MARTNLGQKQSYAAAADYTEKQFYLVYLSAADTVTLSGAAGQVDGILYGKPDSGEYGEVLTASGVEAQVIAGDAVTAGNWLESDSSGRAVPLTIDGDGTTETYTVGKAVTAAGGAGEYITVLTRFGPASK